MTQHPPTIPGNTPPATPLVTQLATPLGRTLTGFIADAAARGVRPHTAKQAYRAFYQRGLTDLPRGVTAHIAPIVRRLEEEVSEGVTVKFCQRLDRGGDEMGSGPPGPGQPARRSDRAALGVLHADERVRHLDIESVVIPMIGRTGRKTHTLCVSSQIGCAMGCGFCETAQMGLIRSLTAAEIVAQWWAATYQILAPSPQSPVASPQPLPHIDNIVFMGMGEPLDNLDAVLDAVACLTDHNGPAVPMSAITISTVGRADGLRRLIGIVQKPGWKRLGIALSVNAPNDRVRDSIMPLNKRYGMGELRSVMIDLMRARPGRKILFEYVLIPGVNDAPEHALELASWLEPFTGSDHRSAIGLLNIIPYNPRRNSPWPAPDEADAAAFVARMNSLGVYTKRRRTKGRTTMSACGQLGAPHIRARRFVPDPADTPDTPGTPQPASRT